MSLRHILLITSLILAVLLAFVFLQLPGNTLFWRAFQNSGHAILFSALSTLVLILLHRLGTFQVADTLLYSSASLFILGLLIEFGQHLTGRGASFDDLAFNSAGIVNGCCLFLLTSSIKRRISSAKKCLIFSLAGMTVMWAMQYPAIYFFSGMLRPPFPVLANFENLGAEHFTNTQNSSHIIAMHSIWTQNPSRSLQVKFETDRSPNVQFLEPEKNWSNFSQLEFKAYNPAKQLKRIRIRIDDQSLGPLDEDHMTVTRILQEGENLVVIDLEEFKADAAQRSRPGTATFKRIRSFMVYISAPQFITTLYFDDFSLN